LVYLVLREEEDVRFLGGDVSLHKVEGLYGSTNFDSGRSSFEEVRGREDFWPPSLMWYFFFGMRKLDVSFLLIANCFPLQNKSTPLTRREELFR